MSLTQCECHYECEGMCVNVSVTLSASVSIMRVHLGGCPVKLPVYSAKLHLWVPTWEAPRYFKIS